MRNFRNAVNNSDAMKVFDGLDDWTKSTQNWDKQPITQGNQVLQQFFQSFTYLMRDKYGSKVAAEDAVAHTGIAVQHHTSYSVLGTDTNSRCRDSN